MTNKTMQQRAKDIMTKDQLKNINIFKMDNLEREISRKQLVVVILTLCFHHKDISF
jgi:hypothetical protein